MFDWLNTPTGKRLKNPAVNTALLFGAVFATWALGSSWAHESERKRQKKKRIIRPKQSVCPEGTVFDGEKCVAPEPSPFPSPRPPFPGPGPGPVPPEPVPDPGPGPIPTPEPTPQPPEPSPGPKPGAGDSPNPLPKGLMAGASSSPACVKNTYNRMPIRVPLDVFQGWHKAARDWTRNKLYNMYATPLRTFVSMVSQRYQTWPSLRSVVVRDALAEVTDCDWYIDTDEMTNAQQNLYASATDLARAVEAELQWSPPDQWSDLPMGYDDEVLARPLLGLPSPGVYNFKPGQIVELVVMDDTLRYAEHLFARILSFDQDFDCFEFRVIPVFQNRNVSPKFTHKHGVELGRKGCLARTGGGAYRVYPLGVT